MANAEEEMTYACCCYEEPGEPGSPDNYWHIYSANIEPGHVRLGSTILTIKAPETEEMYAAIRAICLAIDAAIDLSLGKRRTGEGNGNG